MDIKGTVKISLNIFKVNKKRTFLTTLGIIIGVAAVIIVMSVGAGAQSLIFNQITSMGSNLIGVLPGYSDENGPPASAFGIQVTTLKQKDADSIEKIKEIESAVGYVRGVETVRWQNQKTEATYVGTGSEYTEVEETNVAMGNFFSDTEERGVSKVAVLGWEVYRELFGSQNPVGERIKIKRESFRVIGVMEKRGVEGFQNQDILVFIPLKTAQNLLLGINHVTMIRAKVKKEDDIPIAIAKTEQVLRENHNIALSEKNDFSIRSSAQALEVLETITGALTLFLGAIAALSLVVGGIGIMNIMLVSVNERTREIGLRKAVGATYDEIQLQFLVESIIITVAGGAIGIILGIGISGAVALAAKAMGYSWDFIVSISSIIAGAGISS